MKATSHAIEDYIFGKIVLPLKDLRLRGFDPSPPTDKFTLRVEKDQEQINRQMSQARFNYQRDMAREKAPLIVVMEVSHYGDIVIGRFDNEKKLLTLCKNEASNRGLGHVVGKIFSMFANYPQYKVQMKGGWYE